MAQIIEAENLSKFYSPKTRAVDGVLLAPFRNYLALHFDIVRHLIHEPAEASLAVNI